MDQSTTDNITNNSQRSGNMPKPKEKGFPKGGKPSWARKGYQQNRSTEFCEVVSWKVDAADKAAIKKDLFVCESLESVPAHLDESESLLSIPISVTSRGIGLSLCNLTYMSVAYHDNIAVLNIYTMYRAYLGVFEAKLESLKPHYPLLAWNINFTYDYHTDVNFIHDYCTNAYYSDHQRHWHSQAEKSRLSNNFKMLLIIDFIR